MLCGTNGEDARVGRSTWNDIASRRVQKQYCALHCMFS